MIAGIIIAKKHSTRLPGKNMLPFCGLPLFLWSVIQSKCSHLIDKTYLSTDSEKIAQIGEEHGAEIIWRDYNEDENASAGVPYLHALEHILEKHDVEIVAPLLPTTPQRKPSDLDRGIRIFQDLTNRGVKLRELTSAAVLHECVLYRRQGSKIRNMYLDKYFNSALDATVCCLLEPHRWIKHQRKYMLKKHTDTNVDRRMHTNNLIAFPWPWLLPQYREWRHFWPVETWQVQDINYQEEFDYIEMIMERFILKGRGPDVYYDYKSGRRDYAS